jgi:hypothetical protein
MINNKQQTAVEWFSVRRDVLEIEVRLGKLSPIKYAEELTKAEQQAKEMEKERIETAYNKGTVHGIDYPESILPITGEQYYNETYGEDEQ